MLIIVTGVVVYSNSLSVPFLLDDHAAIAENESIRKLWPPWQVLSPPRGTSVAGRPVANLTFALNHALSGLEVQSYHVVNLAIHVLAALVLFGIVRRTLRCASLRETFGRASSALALSAALIWVVHPLQTESVTYIVQRVESLMGLFYLLTLYCAIRSFTSGRGWWSAAAVVFCALGMATKEVMVTVPVMVLLYDRLFVVGSFREILRRRWRLYVGLAVTWVILVVLVAGGPRSGAVGFGFKDMTVWGYARIQGPVILHYLRLVFWPHPLVFDYGWVPPEGAVGVLPGVLAVSGLVAASILALVYRPRLGFLGAWFFLILGPSSSFLPIRTELAAEHRMYLPLAAVVVLVVVGCRRVGRSLPTRWRGLSGTVAAIVAVAMLGYAAHQRNGDYRSAHAIWTDTVAKQPGNFRAHVHLGTALEKERRYDEAIRSQREALRLLPECYPAHVNIGVVLARQGKYEQAVDSFFEALKLSPDDARVRCNLGVLLARLDRIDEAVIQLRHAVRLKPSDASIRHDAATVLAGYGRTEEAIRHYREATRLKPDWAGPANNLAWLLATHPDARFRNGTEAVRLATRACELTGYKAFWTLDTLAAAYAEAGRFGEAVRTARRALDIVLSQSKDGSGVPREMVALFRTHLKLYEAGRPCRESPEKAGPFFSEDTR